MAATYIMIPFTALACFMGAALESWLAVFRASLPIGIAFGAVFLTLAYLLMRQEELEFTPLATGLATMLGSGFASRWLTEYIPFSAPIIELVLIDVVMLVLVAIAGFIEYRRRARWDMKS